MKGLNNSGTLDLALLGLGYPGQRSRNDKDHAMTISFSLGF